MKKQLLTIILVFTFFCLKAQIPIGIGDAWINYTVIQKSAGVSINLVNTNDLEINSTVNPANSLLLVSNDTNLLVQLNVQFFNPGNFDFEGNTYTSDIILTCGDSIFLESLNAPQVIISPTVLNQTGFKEIGQKRIILFSTGNKIKVNSTIDEKLQLNVFNTLGQLVIQTDLKQENETSLPTGIYSVQVVDSNSKIILSKKVIITE